MSMLKLVVLGGIGYLAYKMLQDLPATAGRGNAGAGGGRSSRHLSRALDENAGRMNVTGPGRGTTVSVEEPTGAMHRQTVGRGVVTP
ncbi:MAG TPA: hypothetical protein VIL86_09945 [Tepidisphaeraceae bacterium]|jgi:hypothetical protein